VAKEAGVAGGGEEGEAGGAGVGGEGGSRSGGGGGQKAEHLLSRRPMLVGRAVGQVLSRPPEICECIC
jgi:hypothetical protein